MSFHVIPCQEISGVQTNQTMHLPVCVVHMFKDEAWRLGEGIPHHIQKLHNVWPSAHLDSQKTTRSAKTPATPAPGTENNSSKVKARGIL